MRSARCSRRFIEVTFQTLVKRRVERPQFTGLRGGNRARRARECGGGHTIYLAAYAFRHYHVGEECRRPRGPACRRNRGTKQRKMISEARRDRALVCGWNFTQYNFDQRRQTPPGARERRDDRIG